MIELDKNERRELYKAMRSAHDGICPACGGEVALIHVAYDCCDCDFKLSGNEVDLIKSWRNDFHRDLDALLVKWRK